jgi:hypothetical protein
LGEVVPSSHFQLIAPLMVSVTSVPLQTVVEGTTVMVCPNRLRLKINPKIRMMGLKDARFMMIYF